MSADSPSRIKQLALRTLGHVAYAFVGSLALYLALFTALLVGASADKLWRKYKHYANPTTYTGTPVQRIPGNVGIVEHRREEANDFTITVTAKNNSAEAITSAVITATVFAEDAKMASCAREEKYYIRPDEQFTFQLRCYGVAGRNLPDNIRYELGVFPLDDEE